MDEVRILEIKQSVFANNDQRAELLRRELKEKERDGVSWLGGKVFKGFYGWSGRQ